MKPLVSLITVNYNGLSDTCDMIESFRRYETYPHYEIIVVDNASRQPEADEMEKRYAGWKAVKVVRNGNNGFAGGNNAGLRVAEGEFLFFINNDTFITAPVLQALVDRLLDAPENGGVSPMLKYASHPDRIQYAGFTPLTHITLRNASIGFRQTDGPAFHTAMPTTSLHGAAMMVSRKVVEKAGRMTEVYFLFYEELDWSAQICRAGYRLWYEPAAVVYHKEGMTARKGSPFREFYLSRARIFYARRNRSGLYRLLSVLYGCCIAAVKKSICYLLQGEFRLAGAVVRGTWQGATARCHD